MSMGTSIYTTPSKATLKGARACGNIEWFSSQGSEGQGPGTIFTAELALAKYRLGAWESPADIESTPASSNTTSSFSSSPSLRLSQEENGIATDVPIDDITSLASSNLSLQAVGPEGLVTGDAEESSIDEHSTASSDISWYYDSETHHEKLVSTMDTQNHSDKRTVPQEYHGDICEKREDMFSDISNRKDFEEASACSTVSSLTMYKYFGQAGGEFMVPVPLSACTSSLSRHDGIRRKSDEVSEVHFAHPGSNGDKMDSSTDDSCCLNGHSIATSSNSVKSVSFSVLISTLEAESLAKRLKPCIPTSPRKMIGKMINTNTPGMTSNPGNLDGSDSRSKVVKTPVPQTKKQLYLIPKQEGEANFGTPKMSNVSTDLSDYSHMIPDAWENNHGATSVATTCCTEKKECSGIRSKFEAQSLKDRTEPLVPRRTIGKTFRSVIQESEGGKKMEYSDCTKNECFNDQNQNSDANFERDIPSSSKEANSCQLSSSLSEEISKTKSDPQEESAIENNAIYEIENNASHEISNAAQMIHSEESLEACSEFHDTKTEISDEDRRVEEKSIDSSRPKRTMNNYPTVLSKSEEEDQNELHLEGEERFTSDVSVSSLEHQFISEAEDSSEVVQSLLTATFENEVYLDEANMVNKQTTHLRFYNGPVDLDDSVDTSSSVPVNDEETILSQEQVDHRTLSTLGFYNGPVDLDDSIDSSSSAPVNDKEINLSEKQVGHRTLLIRNDKGYHGEIDTGSQKKLDHVFGSSEKQFNPCEEIGFVSKQYRTLSIENSSQGSLNEDDLKYKLKQRAENGSFPNSAGPCYNDWKREQEEKSLRHQVEKQEQVLQFYLSSDDTTNNSKAKVDAIVQNNLSTIQELQVPPKTKKISRMLSRILQVKRRTRKKSAGKRKDTGLDKFVAPPGNDFEGNVDDISEPTLLPLNTFGYLIDSSGREAARQQTLLVHLESERQKQMQSAIEKEREELGEHIRNSVLKERKLERQRFLSHPTIDSITYRVASPGVGFSTNKPSLASHVMKANHESKLDNLLNSSKPSKRGCMYSTTPIKYWFHGSTRATTSTARETVSLESCSVNSFLHKSLSFNSAQTPSSPNSPKSITHLPPCVVCKISERTHICISCMHYSFCAECAKQLQKLETPICPICQTEDVVLTMVYT
ncbi:unnamed protein product [Pseudo-nitzschia multistriata]|uniref:RING-type domain-containing protein n=1 Tax=Pseudo-nitzschia multistriata TaxID=183589 RepID=A0A448ZB64_9STRA|nr:unnamed protein product [Pseudo-nitzschia multistriata]